MSSGTSCGAGQRGSTESEPSGPEDVIVCELEVDMTSLRPCECGTCGGSHSRAPVARGGSMITAGEDCGATGVETTMDVAVVEAVRYSTVASLFAAHVIPLVSSDSDNGQQLQGGGGEGSRGASTTVPTTAATLPAAAHPSGGRNSGSNRGSAAGSDAGVDEGCCIQVLAEVQEHLELAVLNVFVEALFGVRPEDFPGACTAGCFGCMRKDCPSKVVLQWLR